MNRQVIMDALKTSKVKIDFRSLNSNRNITGIYTGHPAGQTTESNLSLIHI